MPIEVQCPNGHQLRVQGELAGKTGLCPRCHAKVSAIRRYLTEEQWQQMEHLLPGREGCRGVHAADNRLFVNAIIWVARTGAPWRDLPERFGPWNSVFQRFNRWAKRGVWQKVFEIIQDPDLESLVLDSTTIRVRQQAAGAVENKMADAQALGRSRSGRSDKIHLAVDAQGQPLELQLEPSQEYDATCEEELFGIA